MVSAQRCVPTGIELMHLDHLVRCAPNIGFDH
jgi:hypothetical protein